MNRRELMIAEWVCLGERDRTHAEWEAFSAEHGVTHYELETAMLKACWEAVK